MVQLGFLTSTSGPVPPKADTYFGFCQRNRQGIRRLDDWMIEVLGHDQIIEQQPDQQEVQNIHGRRSDLLSPSTCGAQMVTVKEERTTT